MANTISGTGWPRTSDGFAKQLLRNNGLSIAVLLLFSASLVGQAMTGLASYNEEALEHGRRALRLAEYIASGDFIEAVFENWESEFLQMAIFVVLTKVLRQRGSSESKSMDESEEVDEDPNEARGQANAPWPVRRGGWALALYEHSLSLTLFSLFLTSFGLHAWGGMRQYNEEQLRHAGESVSLQQFIGTSDFWQQSFQNWQSEFLSIGVIVLLTIFLRERGSSQSKPVAAPHAETGK
jgi:hypothetical protein